MTVRGAQWPHTRRGRAMAVYVRRGTEIADTALWLFSRRLRAPRTCFCASGLLSSGERPAR